MIIAGHHTSVAMEPEFWAALEDIAKARGQSVAQLVAEIDEVRQGINLTSSIRVIALRWFREPDARDGLISQGS